MSSFQTPTKKKRAKSHDELEHNSPNGAAVISEFIAVDNADKKANQLTSYPCLVSFRGGPKKLDGLHATLRKRKLPDGEDQQRQQPELFVESEDNQRRWHGPAGFHDMYSDFVIGVRRKGSKEMKLMQVGSLYAVRPYTAHEAGAPPPAPIDSDESDGEEGEADVSPTTYAEKRRKLLQTFGGAKSMRMVTRMEKNAITDEKVDDGLNAGIRDSVRKMRAADGRQGITYDENGVTDDSKTTEDSAPPHNNAATSPHDAYPLERLILPYLFPAFEQNLKNIFEPPADEAAADGGTGADGQGKKEDGSDDVNGRDETMEDVNDSDADDSDADGEASTRKMLRNPGYLDFIWDIIMEKIDTCRKFEDVDESIRTQIYCCMNLHNLIILHTCGKNITKGTIRGLVERMVGLSEIAVLGMIVPFTTSQQEYGKQDMKVCTDNNKSFIRKHVLLMWLRIHDFDAQLCGESLQILAQIIGIVLKLLLVDAAALGCKIKKSSKKMMSYRVSLPVPLQFPVIKHKNIGKARKKLF